MNLITNPSLEIGTPPPVLSGNAAIQSGYGAAGSSKCLQLLSAQTTILGTPTTISSTATWSGLSLVSGYRYEVTLYIDQQYSAIGGDLYVDVDPGNGVWQNIARIENGDLANGFQFTSLNYFRAVGATGRIRVRSIATAGPDFTSLWYVDIVTVEKEPDIMAQMVLIPGERIPANKVKLFPRGALIDGSQVGVNTVTVSEGHDFEVGHKFLYCPSRSLIWRNRVFTVTAKTATTVTFSGATFTFQDGAYLLNLGTETGGTELVGGTFSRLNLDGSSVYPYRDPSTTNRFDSDEVPLDPNTGYTFWTDNDLHWAVAINSGGQPIQIWPDVGVGDTGHAKATRGAVFPTTPNPGDWHIYEQGAGLPDISYQYVKKGDDTYAWIEVFRAPA